MAVEASEWIGAVRASHERLQALVEPLGGDALRARSYDTEWSIADVLSHLGSGAQIFDLFLEAGLGEGEVPGREQFEAIWATWNAKSAEAQAADSLATNAAFVGRLAALDEAAIERLRIPMFGQEFDASGLMRMRLGEHAVHTWDVAVALDDTARVAPDAVNLLVDTLGQLAARSGKPAGVSMRVRIYTSAPERAFDLELADAVTLTEAGDELGLAELRLPAEAFVRLVYGRLDVAHTPELTTSVDIDLLRSVFPGF